MKLWILKPIEDWTPWYDCVFGLVVRAESVSAARALVAAAKYPSPGPGAEGREVWLDPTLTTCERLSEHGAPGVIIEDGHAA